MPLWLVAVIIAVLWSRALNAERYSAILEADRLGAAAPVSQATGLPHFELPTISWEGGSTVPCRSDGMIGCAYRG